MNGRRLGTAFLIALFISGMCTWVLSRKIGTHAAERVPDQRYVAPAKAIQAGELLKPESLEYINWPAANPIAGTFTKMDDLVGRVVLFPMDKDQPITDKVLSAPGSGPGLAAKIPAGMRAIALRSDEVMGVAGFLFPGSHLDVLVTYHTDRSPEPVTLTVLQDAEVLAAGQNTQPDPTGKPITATVVTLLLTPDDAQRAVMASSQGAIHFVLRSGADKSRVQESSLALSQLSGGPAAAPLAPLPNAAAAPSTGSLTHEAPSAPAASAARPQAPKNQYTIETIAGEKTTSDTFSGVK